MTDKDDTVVKRRRRKPYVAPPPVVIIDTTMTIDHPAWRTFTLALEGPFCCNFRKNAAGKITWTCSSTIERELSTKLLTNMGCDVLSSLAYFASHGGYCDCEILFNVERNAKGGRRGRPERKRLPKRAVKRTGTRKNPNKRRPG